ncbi:MAG: hypothetical protein FJY95_19555 [Candidatus Handelsmanbacteria bacterium]|nr:hypothetical protein [Candidatus Handelsmanbacteria bacterium]
MPATHPRILFLVEDRQTLLDLRDEPMYCEFFAALRQQLDKDLEAPLPPIGLCDALRIPGGISGRCAT